MTSQSQAHDRVGVTKEQRLVFGDDAVLYDRARPSYPLELMNDLVALVGVPARALDAGCGTGKATVMLAERSLEGVGVEPDSDMAAIAREKLKSFPSWRVDVSDFERWAPQPGESPYDLITAAQSWHWMERELATKQAERLLRRGGWLAIFGHRPNPPDVPLRHAIDAIYDELAPQPSAVSRAPKEPVTPRSKFGTPIEREYPGFQDYTAEEWIAVERTSSDKKMLTPDRRELLLSRIEQAIDEHGGTYRHHFVVKLWAAERS